MIYNKEFKCYKRKTYRTSSCSNFTIENTIIKKWNNKVIIYQTNRNMEKMEEQTLYYCIDPKNHIMNILLGKINAIHCNHLTEGAPVGINPQEKFTIDKDTLILQKFYTEKNASIYHEETANIG